MIQLNAMTSLLYRLQLSPLDRKSASHLYHQMNIYRVCQVILGSNGVLSTIQVTQLSQRDRAAGWGLEATYAVLAHWKARSGFTISDNWTFSLGVMAEALRANIDWKLPFLKGVGHFIPKFQVEEDVPPPTISTRLDRPVNVLQRASESFHIKKICSRLS